MSKLSKLFEFYEEANKLYSTAGESRKFAFESHFRGAAAECAALCKTNEDVLRLLEIERKYDENIKRFENIVKARADQKKRDEDMIKNLYKELNPFVGEIDSGRQYNRRLENVVAKDYPNGERYYFYKGKPITKEQFYDFEHKGIIPGSLQVMDYSLDNMFPTEGLTQWNRSPWEM